MKLLIIMLLIPTAGMSIALGQDRSDYGGKQSLGATSSFSPTSSHILIGISDQRRIVTLGGEYTRRFWESGNLRADYVGSVSPLFRESDPTLIGEFANTTPGSPPLVLYTPPERVVTVSHAALRTVCGVQPTCYSVYPLFGRERTYAGSVSPLGARLMLYPGGRIQPSFETDLGVVFASRDLPVEDTASFNYQFSFGPGIEVFTSKRNAIRFEYVFRHISNAGSGNYDPGIDQGVFKLTFSRYE